MYTREDIIKGLDSLGAPKGAIVLMHSSMRMIGEVEGGAEALLDIMVEYFTRDGGLFIVPTHTWANLGKDVPTLDLTRGESNLGIIPTLAARDKRGIRSMNPTHSVVIYGDTERARSLIAGDEYAKTPTSPISVWGKLYYEGAYILLVGVCQNRNTYLHAVDEIQNTPKRMDTKPTKTTIKLDTGAIIERDIRLFDDAYGVDISLRFTKYDTAFRYHRAIVDGYIGDAPTMLCDARVMYDVIEIIHKRGEGLDPLADEKQINPKLYVK